MDLNIESSEERLAVCYLVVDHNVNGAVGGVRRQVRQVERFIDDTLTCKCCVSVEQDGHHLHTHTHTSITSCVVSNNRIVSLSQH